MNNMKKKFSESVNNYSSISVCLSHVAFIASKDLEYNSALL